MRHTKALVVIAGVFVSAIFVGGVAHAGDVYKYVDERGVTLYTDKPIPGAVLVSTGTQRPAEYTARNNAANLANTNAQLSASNGRIASNQNDTRVATNVAKDLEASRAERCKKAREAYTKSISTQYIYRTTADGKREYLNDAELEKTRVDSAKAVEAICGPQG